MCLFDPPPNPLPKEVLEKKEEVTNPATELTERNRARQKDQDNKKFQNLKKSWRAPKKRKNCGEDCGFFVRDNSSIQDSVKCLAPVGSVEGQGKTMMLLLVEDGALWEEVVNEVSLEDVDQVP